MVFSLVSFIAGLACSLLFCGFLSLHFAKVLSREKASNIQVQENQLGIEQKLREELGDLLQDLTRAEESKDKERIHAQGQVKQLQDAQDQAANSLRALLLGNRWIKPNPRMKVADYASSKFYSRKIGWKTKITG
jgi:hypothetical protein